MYDNGTQKLNIIYKVNSNMNNITNDSEEGKNVADNNVADNAEINELEALYKKLCKKNEQLKSTNAVDNKPQSNIDEKMRDLLKKEIEEKLRESKYLEFLDKYKGKSIEYIYFRSAEEDPEIFKLLQLNKSLDCNYALLINNAITHKNIEFIKYLVEIKKISLFQIQDRVETIHVNYWNIINLCLRNNDIKSLDFFHNKAAIDEDFYKKHTLLHSRGSIDVARKTLETAKSELYRSEIEKYYGKGYIDVLDYNVLDWLLQKFKNTNTKFPELKRFVEQAEIVDISKIKFIISRISKAEVDMLSFYYLGMKCLKSNDIDNYEYISNINTANNHGIHISYFPQLICSTITTETFQTIMTKYVFKMPREQFKVHESRYTDGINEDLYKLICSCGAINRNDLIEYFVTLKVNDFVESK